MSATMVAQDSDELEALFDSIIRENAARDHAAAPKTQVDAKEDASGDVMGRIGRITRTLHDSLRELGYDRLLEKTAACIPDARDHLDYVVKMTEQAAVRALNAIDAAQPMQDRLGEEAARLSAQWQKLYDKQLSLDQFKTLVSGTRDYLGEVPKQTGATNAQLLEIMMAQDFHDLTGQVIKRLTSAAQRLEVSLVALLLETRPPEAAPSEPSLSGPAVRPSADTLADQGEVDRLLESLGF